MRVRYILQRHACVNFAIQEYVNHWKKERNQVRPKTVDILWLASSHPFDNKNKIKAQKAHNFSPVIYEWKKYV